MRAPITKELLRTYKCKGQKQIYAAGILDRKQTLSLIQSPRGGMELKKLLEPLAKKSVEQILLSFHAEIYSINRTRQ